VYTSLDDLTDDHYDVIISNHVLEHVLDPYAVLVSARRKLKLNGKLVFCVPVDDWRVQRSYRPDDQNNHLYTWSPQDLGNLFKEAGYNIMEVRLIRHAWTPKLYRLLGKIDSLFQAACFLLCILRKRYQILIVAEKPI
jgi:SAM-dependent methyltransferase